MTQSLQIQDRAADKRLSSASPVPQAATVLATSYPSQVTVNLNGGSIPVLCVGGQFPTVGDSVMVLQIGTTFICLGALPKPAHGVVTAAASGGRVSVLADDGVTYSVNYNHLYTPAVADHVKLDWDLIGGFIVGPLAAAPTGDPNLVVPTGVPPTSASKPSARTVTFHPTGSGTWNGSSYFTSEVWCGDSSNGIFVYGSQIASTIPDGAAITAGKIYLDVRADYYPASLATLGSSSLGSLSGGFSVSNVQSVSAGSGWKTLGANILNALKTGAARGIGFDGGGQHKYAPKGVGNSGAISITWKV